MNKDFLSFSSQAAREFVRGSPCKISEETSDETPDGTPAGILESTSRKFPAEKFRKIFHRKLYSPGEAFITILSLCGAGGVNMTPMVKPSITNVFDTREIATAVAKQFGSKGINTSGGISEGEILEEFVEKFPQEPLERFVEEF